MKTHILLTLVTAALISACRAPAATPAPVRGYWDAHTHLSLYGADALDSLTAYGVVAVRDLGTDLDSTLQWKQDVALGKRRGPRIFTAGVILDGPKQDATPRWMLRTIRDAELAVDSLARRGVDFIKTHNGLERQVYFAVLRQARLRGLSVASHLPRGVPAWEAADSGVGSIEHVAESMLASPMYAGFAATPAEAMAWWRSPAGDSALARLAATGVSVTPTLALYAANVDRPSDPAVRQARREALDFLVELTRRMYLAGVPLMAGSDVAHRNGSVKPGASLHEEIKWLRRAGIPDSSVAHAASRNVERWLQGAPGIRTGRHHEGVGERPALRPRPATLSTSR